MLSSTASSWSNHQYIEICMHTTCNILPSPRTESNFVPDHYQALSDLINLTNKYGKDDEIVGHIHTLKAPVYNSLIKQRSCKIIL